MPDNPAYASTEVYLDHREKVLTEQLAEVQEMKKNASIIRIPLTNERERLIECYRKIIIAHQHYLDWDIKEIKLQALWDIATYFHQGFETFPYRFVNAMKGSGKTRLLRMTENIVWNGKLTTGSLGLSDSALFREAGSHTLILDEAEGIGKKEKQAQREILNSGYKKGSSVTRMEEKYINKERKHVPTDYPTYGPKMIANINGMDEVLGDRCISSILEKSSNPAKTMLMEDFSQNPFFIELRRTLSAISVVCAGVVTFPELYNRWNYYISSCYTTSTTHPTSAAYTTYTYTTLHTTHYNTPPLEEEKKKENDNFFGKDIVLSEEQLALFERIREVGISGRNLELYFPLFIVAHSMSPEILTDILLIAKEKTQEKVENDFYESHDIAVFDFISRQQPYLEYVSISALLQEFKHFYQADEDREWLNARWFGKAIARLNLASYRRRLSHGVEIIPNVAKAKEKITFLRGQVTPTYSP